MIITFVRVVAGVEDVRFAQIGPCAEAADVAEGLSTETWHVNFIRNVQ